VLEVIKFGIPTHNRREAIQNEEEMRKGKLFEVRYKFGTRLTHSVRKSVEAVVKVHYLAQSEESGCLV